MIFVFLFVGIDADILGMDHTLYVTAAKVPLLSVFMSERRLGGMVHSRFCASNR